MSKPLQKVQRILELIDEIKKLANQVLIDKSAFLKTAFFVVNLRSLLEALILCEEFLDSNSSWEPLEQLGKSIELIHNTIKDYLSKSRIFLLYHSPCVVNQIKTMTQVLADNISMLAEKTAISADLKEQMLEMADKLAKAVFFPDPGNEELAKSLSDYLAKGHMDEQGSTSLLRQIADHLRVPLSAAAGLKLELLRDKESAMSKNEYMRELDGLVMLLQNAEVLDDVRKLASEDSSLTWGSSLLVPASFFCPITGQVMQEPVLIEGGYTYEKNAIKEWFERGHRTCPDTGMELSSLDIEPNYGMKLAMDEFFDRVFKEKIRQAIEKIRDDGSAMDKEEAVCVIKELIDTNSKYKRHVVCLDGIKHLVLALKTSHIQVKEKILRILCSIAMLGDEYKVQISNAGVVPLLLRVLTKCQGDNLYAVHLLLEISKTEEGRKLIIAEKGAILTIAMAVNIEISEQKLHAIQVLENLCCENYKIAIDAAAVGLFGPLMGYLSTGDDHVRYEMASAIYEKLELNDSTNHALVSAGVVPPLLDCLQNGSSNCRLASVKALRCLSAIDINKVTIAKAGAIPILVKYLGSELKLEIISTLANLATDQHGAIAIDQEGAVSRLLEMLRLGDNLVKEYSLVTLQFLAKTSQTVRATVKRSQGVPKLFSLLQHKSLSAPCRVNIMGLLYHLAADRDCRPALEICPPVLQLMFQLLTQKISAEEMGFILGILAGMAKNGKQTKLAMISEDPFETLIACLKSNNLEVTGFAATVICRLIHPDLGINIVEPLHIKLVALGIYPLLLNIIESGSSRGKLHAAVILGYFSVHARKLTQVQPFFKKLLSRLGFKRYKICKVHGGQCTGKTTLCLVEAGAVPGLITLIGDADFRVAEHAVEALLTLVQTGKGGVDYLVKNGILKPVIALVGKTPSSSEKAVKVLERIFKFKNYRDDKYSKAARSGLTSTMTTGTIEAKKAAATALMHLGLMPRGSTYTGEASLD